MGSDEITKHDWLYIMNREKWKCLYCECALNGENRTVDHIIPLSKGGRNIKENLVACCKFCNSVKNNKMFSEFDGIKNLSDEKYEFLGKQIIEYGLLD